MNALEEKKMTKTFSSETIWQHVIILFYLCFNEKGQWNIESGSQGAAFHFVSSEVMRTICFVL